MQNNKRFGLNPLSKRLLKLTSLFAFFVLAWTVFALWGNGRLWHMVPAFYFGYEEMMGYAPSILAAGICASFLLDMVISKKERE